VSEPKSVAAELEEGVPGVLHRRLSDERIGGSTSASHAVAHEGGHALIDPLPLAENGLARLQPVVAICLTAQCHQRSAWRYRRRFAAPVYAPETRPMEEEPDVRYHAVEMLIELPFSVLCLDHGAPVSDDPKSAIRELLDRQQQ
jgi:hypothetical protein